MTTQNLYQHCEISYILAEEEFWPFRDNTLDLIVSNLHLQFAQESEIALKSILDSLVPDGLFCGMCYGESTLKELRNCFYLVENERSGGVSSHIYKFDSISGFGNRMNKVGFNLTSFVDQTTQEHFYDAFHLMDCISRAGLGYASQNARQGCFKEVFLGVNAIYEVLFSEKYEPKEEEVRFFKEEVFGPVAGLENEQELQEVNLKKVVPATFELINFVGFKFHMGQQKPAQRGTGNSLKEFVDEVVGDDEEARKRVKYGELFEEEEKKE